MTILSEKDWAFWEENGYVVIPSAVPQENLDALVETIWAFLEMDPSNAEELMRMRVC
ncbi:hypothetical protein KFU94_17165 [Chloroflexi bacterium TSY]|nr:hypothetical protein [Chloroflexi bacterium TSY]